MGHEIRHFTCANDKLKSTLRRIEGFAYDPEESCGYHGNMTIHKTTICKDYDEALRMIEMWDKGWYSDHSVRFKDGRKYKWLIKVEWHV